MPRFKIKRKKKVTFEEPTKVEPMDTSVEPTETKIDDSETTIDENGMETDASDSLESVTRSVQSMKVDSEPQSVATKPQYQPQQPRYEQPSANVARQDPYRYNNGPRPSRNAYATNQLYRKPTMPNPHVRPKRRTSNRRLTFRSHYGPGGEHLDTRTKAQLLYQHCFA